MSKLKRAFQDPTFQQLLLMLDPHLQASCPVFSFDLQNHKYPSLYIYIHTYIYIFLSIYIYRHIYIYIYRYSVPGKCSGIPLIQELVDFVNSRRPSSGSVLEVSGLH